MLAQLEVYAAECYNKTTDHIFAINQFSSIDELTEYKFNIGYPNKLIFDLSKH